MKNYFSASNQNLKGSSSLLHTASDETYYWFLYELYPFGSQRKVCSSFDQNFDFKIRRIAKKISYESVDVRSLFWVIFHKSTACSSQDSKGYNIHSQYSVYTLLTAGSHGHELFLAQTLIFIYLLIFFLLMNITSFNWVIGINFKLTWIPCTSMISTIYQLRKRGSHSILNLLLLCHSRQFQIVKTPVQNPCA